MAGEKRATSAAEERDRERELGFPRKRARDMRQAAEIVLVLAAMGEMRGGVGPTVEEREMMAEAREKLVRACEGFAPKDVFPGVAFELVMEDVGLKTRIEDKKMGLRPSKMSIADKFLITKHKVVRVWCGSIFILSYLHSCIRFEVYLKSKLVIVDKLLIVKHKRFQTNSGTAMHATATPPLHKPSPATFPSGKIQHAYNGSTVNSTSQPYQLPTSEVKTPAHSSGLPTVLLGRNSSTPSVSKVNLPQIRPETRANGSSYALPTKVIPCGDQAQQKSPAFVQQVQSSLAGKSRVDGPSVGTTPRVAPQDSRSLAPQATAGHFGTIPQNVRGMNITQGASLSNPHNEIGKIVQKFLQLQMPKPPIWTPPSRDYINKSMPCQVCKVTIDEVENALVCDACEKGYHIKCVESHNQKGVPKFEWHCFKCLSVSNGKPLPPKYGKVTRNMGAPKVHSNTATVQSSQKIKVENLGEKKNQPKVVANGSSDLQSPPGFMGNNQTNSETEINPPVGRETQGNDILSRIGDSNDKHPLGNCSDDITKCSESGCNSDSACLSFKRAHEEKPVIELKGQPPTKKSETGSEMLDHLEAPCNLRDKGQEVVIDKPEVPLVQCRSNNLTMEDLEAFHSRKNLDGNVNGVKRQENQGVVYEPTDTSGDETMANEQLSLQSDVSDNVDWIGDVLKVADEKIYYQSCCVDGVVYKVQDHVLLNSGCNDQFKPSKLQAMWEDRKNRSKWVIVNQCYFHDDLPKEVGLPFPLESKEVCESNHGITIMAGLIRGPCEVLPPGKHIEESQRRSRLSSREKDGLRPIYLCKWFFDESKGSFRDVSR